MKVKAIPIGWVLRGSRRMDCNPYLSGALEARIRLEEMRTPKQPLESLTLGGAAGIYHAGREGRTWVRNRRHGVPFLGSTKILAADLSELPLLSVRQVESNPRFIIHEGWTLITRSGTIGRMAYARPEMDGMACSEHVMRVVPDPNLVHPGFLYAYLNSKFGVPLVVSGTYGSIIQSIEPQHIADLPVPRFGTRFESEVHTLVQEAADARTRARLLRRDALDKLYGALGLADVFSHATSTSFAVFSHPAASLSRLDAAHYAPPGTIAQEELVNTDHPTCAIEDVARVFTPGIFKRKYVDDPSNGYPYFSGSDLFLMTPAPRGFLNRRSKGIDAYLVKTGWILVQDAGQLGGLIGQALRVGPTVSGGAASNHLMRIVPADEVDAAYLLTVLQSPHGYRAITRHAFGTSIPQLDPKHISSVEIPWPARQLRMAISAPMVRSWGLEDHAVSAESEALRLVEAAIEDAA